MLVVYQGLGNKHDVGWKKYIILSGIYSDLAFESAYRYGVYVLVIYFPYLLPGIEKVEIY
jgi:hypothetical protein